MLDVNTYDFGARMYDSAIARWTCVDPMGEKHINRSPYNYCENNPMAFVDPDGRDEWEINTLGQIVGYIKTKVHDAIYIVDDKGYRINNKYIIFKYGTIRSTTQEDDFGTSYDVYEMRNDELATLLFEFLAKNTSVEWSQAKNGISGEKGLNFITSSHHEDHDAGMTDLFFKQLRFGYTIRELNHSHYLDVPYPSGLKERDEGDIAFARMVSRIAGQKINFKIYHVQDEKYIEFNANSQRGDFLFNVKMADIVITPKQDEYENINDSID